jgi:hypothetical protein
MINLCQDKAKYKIVCFSTNNYKTNENKIQQHKQNIPHCQNSFAKSNGKNAETAAASIPITLICLIARFSSTCSLIKKVSGLRE